ncbi:alpha beta-hydrolase [Trichoderma arundinaceum]|uniref:Alpha beta-hydrolase n=1 Tax=Trichoderma arundinaceum TaxID=490622 RepID=A0A395NWB2_TRIAR|nr:alpha beta-hydrolase [Trichoderma arundinaceum]
MGMRRESIAKVAPWYDPDISHEYATLNGRRYHYLLGEPKNIAVKNTVVLVHGFQDIAFGWRYQIKPLVALGLRVVAIDCIGYGGTEAPHVPPESIRLYTFKRAADDIKELASQIDLVSHIFTLGTPYLPPMQEWLEFEDYIVKYPTFKYQGQFAGKELENRLSSKEALRQFWIATYGGRGPNGEAAFSTERALFENWPLLIRSDVLSEEELIYYVEEYARNGISAALNWYRNRRENWEDERW